ncbi:MAG: hypothetical protein IPP11_12070 [Chitinophagaceae bacterium]|nr:hypothetical protein [Chitinophagaceae bacterium]
MDKANWKYKQFDNYYKAIEKIQSYGISVNGCFILGFDTDTLETFNETEKFIKQSNLSEVQITMLTPFPNTELYHQLKKKNGYYKKTIGTSVLYLTQLLSRNILQYRSLKINFKT